MAFLKIEYHSKALAMERWVNVIYPDGFEIDESEVDDTDIPVLYLLHGMGGNENSWQKRTGIERLLRHTNLIVVMPRQTSLGIPIPSIKWLTTMRLRLSCHKFCSAFSQT